MFDLSKFIADSVTKRAISMFAADIETNKDAYAEKVGLPQVEIGQQATVAIKSYMECCDIA